MPQQPKIIALIKYSQKGASSRVRFWNLALGWDIEVWPLLDDGILENFYRLKRHDRWKLFSKFIGRVSSIPQVESPDLWWVEKEIHFGMPAFAERILAPIVSRAVIDYDDAVYLNYKDAWCGPLGRSAKFSHYARNAAYITVGSEHLRKQMTAWGATRLKTIPSTVLTSDYDQNLHIVGRPITIGWIGTPVTVLFLEALRCVFPLLAKKIKYQLHVVGAHWACEGVDVVCTPWSEQTEARLVSSFDIGIMPLIDGEWEKAKCSYKIIQYMAAGAVPVGSRVGENKIVVEEGITGYLASNPAEWLEKLKMLCENHHLRASVGANARAKAFAKYDVSHAVAAMNNVFTEVLSQRR